MSAGTDNHATSEILTDLKFSEFDLHPDIVKGLGEAGFERLTPIQAKSLPLALEGRDIAGQAQTGTGKTAAFLVAAFQRLLSREPAESRKKSDPRAIILAPTRELAIQIERDADVLGRYCKLKRGLVYGGVDYVKQRSTLEEGVDVLIGTPGRIIDYHKQGVFSLRHIEVVVLDEADRMFDLGFIKDIRFLFRRMPRPQHRQGFLFSATLNHKVTELAYEHMNEPEYLRIERRQMTADQIEEKVYFPANDEKIRLLVGLLRRAVAKSTMVFINTKAHAERVTSYLLGNDINAALLSGDVPQAKRQKLMQRFKDGDIDVLVATDVAARGLHIPDISHVFNFDLPQDAEDYVHRIGRTARFGAKGEAISFACENYAFALPEIEAYIGHKIPTEPVEEADLAELKPPLRRKRPPHPTKARRGAPSGNRSQSDQDPKQKRRRRRRRKPAAAGQGAAGPKQSE